MTLTRPAGLLKIWQPPSISKGSVALAVKAVHFNAHCRASKVGFLVHSKDDQVTQRFSKRCYRCLKKACIERIHKRTTCPGKAF